MLELFTILACLIMNALLSCVEMAFVTVSKPHIKKLAADGDKLAQRLLSLRANPERVLSVLQIGITLVGAVSAAVGGAGAEEYLSPFFEKVFNISEEFSETLAIISVVIPLTYFSVVIGELVPKTIALRSPMKFAKFGALFLIPLSQIFSPVVYVLEISTKLIINPLMKKIGADSITEQSNSVDLDSLSDSHKQYVLNLIEVDKRKVKDILLPWSSVTKVDIGSHYTEIMNIIRQSRHTRMPVVFEDKPMGILHAKEFISEVEISKMNWQALVRPVVKIGFDEPIMSALKTLQSNKSHMAAIFKDENILGIVTLEDIFEEVVGDIYDEDDNSAILLASNSKIRTMSLPKQ